MNQQSFCGHKNHFDTHFPLQRFFHFKDMRKTKWIYISISRIFLTQYSKHLKVSFCKLLSEANEEHSMCTNKLFWPCFHITKIWILKNMCQQSSEAIINNLTNFDLALAWPSVNRIQNGFCWHPPHLLMLSHILAAKDITEIQRGQTHY